jgi:uncharacterized protein involved in response to NO
MVKPGTARVGYWRLVAAGEPFRLLFPFGLAIGVFGVMLWPAFFAGWLEVYPSAAHAGIMIQGFLTCFVFGFLGTALPRLLDVPRITLFESSALAVTVILVTCLHATGQAVAADALFLLVLLGFLAELLLRIPFRRDVPPPGFVLVAMGLFSALTGATILFFASVISPSMRPPILLLGRLLMNQGYLLLPIMGIGAFLLPRFFGVPNRQSFPESLSVPPGWKPRALFAAACGFGVLVSFVLEAMEYSRAGYLLRALAILIYFVREVPFHQAGFGHGALAFGLRIALISIPLGYLLMAIWPEYRATFIHVVFVTGYSLLTLTVASRVVLGHSGQSHLFKAWLPSLLTMTALVSLAMLTRVSADWMGDRRSSHLAYAAAVWAIGALIWGFLILPAVRQGDEGETQ